MRAVDVISDAYRRCNRLSPGETLPDDDIVSSLAILNTIVDELSAQRVFLFKDLTTSVVQTGNITLATGSWAAVPSGVDIVALFVDTVPASPLTMLQYNGIYQATDTGTPYQYAYDGFATIYLYPVATGQTVKLQTRTGVTSFADSTTSYTVPPGYTSMLGATLAVRCAPSLIGKLTPELLREETAAKNAIRNPRPAILNVQSYNRSSRIPGAILSGAS